MKKNFILLLMAMLSMTVTMKADYEISGLSTKHIFPTPCSVNGLRLRTKAATAIFRSMKRGLCRRLT